MSILIVQQKLKAAGFDPGPLDGRWGATTELALDAAIGIEQSGSLAWGNKVSAEFRKKVFAGCRDQGIPADSLMACMAWESAESFSSDIRNAAGSGAVGLIQFMPSTAKDMGTSTALLAGMTPERQLDYVFAYFRPYKGRLKTLADIYMAILWPAAIGRPESSSLWTADERPTTYRQNSGLDLNRDRVISKAEAAAKVQQKLMKGVKPPYVWRSSDGKR